MKIILKILFVAMLCNQFSIAQTIKKEASNTNPYIGQEFYYTITINGIRDLSDLDRVEDNFGPELDYVGVEYNNTMLALLNGFCNSYSDINSTLHHFILDFDNCNGITVPGLDSFSFKIKVKLNELACDLTDTYDNKAMLYLKSAPLKPIESNVESITVNKKDPFVLQKTFRSSNNGYLIYDVRLSSESGNFYPLDFSSTPVFKDQFTIPSCMTIGSGSNDIEVVLITDENATPMTQAPAINQNVVRNGNIIDIDWNLQGATDATSSILYQVKFKIDDCSTCGTTLFPLKNEVWFSGKDKCGNPIKKNEVFMISNAACINNGIVTPEEPKICLSKGVMLDGNTLNFSMKGCTGKYIITVNNCTDRIIYKNFTLTDVIPQELNINGPITISGNATHTIAGQNITVNATAYLNPDDSVDIIIPFEVVTPQRDFEINNCTDITLYGYDSLFTNTPITLTEQACAPPIVTVPNKVAIVAKKIQCTDPLTICGNFKNNNYVPGDIVEYALHFYNYGTVEAQDVKVKDVLPPFFHIQNINTDVIVYRVERQNVGNPCSIESAMKDITREISKNYSTATNLLEIDLKNMELEEFTCEGMVQYVVKIKAKIDINAPNGVYENVYTVSYNDPSTNIAGVQVSNKEPSIVNVDNLVIGYKGFNGNDTSEYINQDCESKTTTVSYKIVMANMGSFDVYVNIDDMVTVPNGVSILGIRNFKKSINSGTFNPITFANTTSTGFNNLEYLLHPCDVVIVTYDVVYDTNLLSKDQTVQACNNATVRVYAKDESLGNAIFTSDPDLIQNYVDATTDYEKLSAIALIKSIEKSPQSNVHSPGERIRIKLNEKCVTLSDCVNGEEKGCFTDNSSTFNFIINGMNRNRQISTTLNTSGKKITKIEYLFTDVRMIDTCEERVIPINNPTNPNTTGNPRILGNSLFPRINNSTNFSRSALLIKKRTYTRACFGCSTNVANTFTTTDISPIGQLNYVFQPAVIGNYSSINKVEFAGAPTVVIQDNRSFNFPANLNCNGTFEFTITAIVYFEDCSVCYITDSFDYNASWRFTIPPRHTPILTGPRHF